MCDTSVVHHRVRPEEEKCYMGHTYLFIKVLTQTRTHLPLNNTNFNTQMQVSECVLTHIYFFKCEFVNNEYDK